MKTLYQNSPIKYSIAGILAVNICGAIGASFLAAVGYAYATNSLLFVNAPFPLELTPGMFTSGVLLFIVAWIYRKRKGLDLMLAYKEIPPE